MLPLRCCGASAGAVQVGGAGRWGVLPTEGEGGMDGLGRDGLLSQPCRPPSDAQGSDTQWGGGGAESQSQRLGPDSELARKGLRS